MAGAGLVLQFLCRVSTSIDQIEVVETHDTNPTHLSLPPCTSVNPTVLVPFASLTSFTLTMTLPGAADCKNSI